MMKLLIGRVGTFKSKELMEAGADLTVKSFKQVYESIKKLKGRTYVISDWDGTIIDSINEETGNKTISAPIAFKKLIKMTPQQEKEVLKEYVMTSGAPFKEQTIIILNKILKVKPAKKLVNDIYREYYKNVKKFDYKSKPFKDLSWVKRINDEYTLIISSSARQETLTKEVREKIRFKPALVLGAREGFKKGRGHWKRIKEKLGKPDNAIIVGDTIIDMKEWKNALKSF